jgi:hypothetical protein
MNNTVISVENLSKAYRLGQVSTRLRHSTRRIGTVTFTNEPRSPQSSRRKPNKKPWRS